MTLELAVVTMAMLASAQRPSLDRSAEPRGPVAVRVEASDRRSAGSATATGCVRRRPEVAVAPTERCTPRRRWLALLARRA